MNNNAANNDPIDEPSAQWLDAILFHWHGKSKPSIDRAIAKTMQRIETLPSKEMTTEKMTAETMPNEIPAEPSPTKTNHERKRIVASAGSRWWMPSIAALLLAGIGLVWWQTSTASAEAIVERAIQASQSLVDRHYKVVIESRGAVGIRKDADLWVRGSDRMVFSITGAWAGTFRVGREGESRWFLGPFGPAINATGSGNPMMRQFDMDAEDMPYLEVETVLKRMKNHYRLERVDNESIEPNGPTLYHVVATLDEQAVKENPPARAPVERIELWGDRWSGAVRQMVLTKSSRAAVIDQWQATITLAEEKKQPDDFYSPVYQMQLRDGSLSESGAK
jgi:hypothetical protein